MNKKLYFLKIFHFIGNIYFHHIQVELIIQIIHFIISFSHNKCSASIYNHIMFTKTSGSIPQSSYIQEDHHKQKDKLYNEVIE